MERLTIFLANGKTLRFEQVTEYKTEKEAGQNVFSFRYVSKADGVRSYAVFDWDRGIVGVSLGAA